MTASDLALRQLVDAIAAGDEAAGFRLLRANPALASARFEEGATRQSPKKHYLPEIGAYVFAGDTALHIAAAGYRTEIVRKLIAMGAEVGARNRRGATPLHRAAVGLPGSPAWSPEDQAATIIFLIEAGADPNAVDKNGSTPLHKAVRTRCAGAVKALLDRGADAVVATRNGSSASALATLTTGRGGVGSPAAKAQQRKILRLLEARGTAR